MRHVWLLTLVVVSFAFVVGTILIAIPQACLLYHFRSADIGLIGACGHLGFAVGCLLWGRLFRNVTGKHVLRGGVVTMMAALGIMATSRSVAVLAGAQVLAGLSCAAVWPFASAWMLDFRSERLSATRLLRHYNLGWTNGMAVGMFLTGIACRKGYILESFYGAMALVAGTLVLATLVRATPPHAPPVRPDTTPAPPSHRIGIRLLVAGLLANVMAFATRMTIQVNYPELNAELGFGADRMGLLTGAAALSQMLAFGFGAAYEPWLGLRRVYVLLMVSLAGSLAAFAWLDALPALLAATVLCGVASAMGFQASILAATRHFASARTGTTLHESLVGTAGLAPFAGGALATALKGADWPVLDALRAPFLALAGAVVAVLAFQLLLVGDNASRRLLAEEKRDGGDGVRGGTSGEGT